MSFRFATGIVISSASARTLFASTARFSAASNSLGDCGYERALAKVTDSRTADLRTRLLEELKISLKVRNFQYVTGRGRS